MVSSAVLSLADVTSETVAALWAKIYGNLRSEEVGRGMLVCKSFHELLPPLITSIGSEPPHTQESFERFAKTYRHLEGITFEQEYDDDLEALDWSKVSFPNLTRLSLSCCPVKSFEFTKANTPSLERLSINNQGQDADEFKLDLPELTHIDMEYCSVRNASAFGPSLSACPKLETFSSYKLWGLSSSKHKLHLPTCTSLSLYRSDDLSWLDVHASELASLNLQACYGLDHVRLYPPHGEECEVNLVNANIDKQSLRHLTQHERVGPELLSRDEDEDGDMGDMIGDYPGAHMGPMGDVMGNMMAQLFQNIIGGGPVDPDGGGPFEGLPPDVVAAMLQQAGVIVPADEEEEEEEEKDDDDDDDEDYEEDSDFDDDIGLPALELYEGGDGKGYRMRGGVGFEQGSNVGDNCSDGEQESGWETVTLADEVEIAELAPCDAEQCVIEEVE